MHVNATFNPTAAWVTQQLREAFPYDTAPKYLIFDGDAIFNPAVVIVVRAMGIKPRRIAYRSPCRIGREVGRGHVNLGGASLSPGCGHAKRRGTPCAAASE